MICAQSQPCKPSSFHSSAWKTFASCSEVTSSHISNSQSMVQGGLRACFQAEGYMQAPHMGFRQLPCHTAWSMCPLCIRDASKRDGSSKMDHGGHSPPSRCSLCLVRNTATMELAWLHSWEAICEVLHSVIRSSQGFTIQATSDRPICAEAF